MAGLGAERVEYLRSLPISIERDTPIGRIVLVHAAPWSNVEVVLPDAEPAVAQRMVAAGAGRVLAYGHIHTPYQRRVGDAVLMCVGAIANSNDADPRPAYTIVHQDGAAADLRHQAFGSAGPPPTETKQDGIRHKDATYSA